MEREEDGGKEDGEREGGEKKDGERREGGEALTHETVFLGVLEHCLVVQVSLVARVIDVGLHPTDVLTPPVSPFPETLPP